MYRKVSTDMNFVEREKEVLGLLEARRHHGKKLPSPRRRGAFHLLRRPAHGQRPPAHRPHRNARHQGPDSALPEHEGQGRPAQGRLGYARPAVELGGGKAAGLDGKPQIEAYGIEPFIAECKKSVWKYQHEWEEMSDRVGFWADMKNPYITYKDDYIESEWWSLKEIWKKGLLYKGFKVVPYCPRCGTALSSHEVAQGYKEVSDVSATVRFKVVGREDTYILAWTTTPWTLPSNVALCVNAHEDYCEFQLEGQTYILAQALLHAVFGEKAHEARCLKP